MSKIHQLPIHEIQKIAAGEVVDRPANVVKELIENSLDAQANHIKICVHDGGKELIRVIDNGCGMDRIDAKCCFDHHATSKISTLADLDTITTFGFRGEALSSIAAVSHVTLITKELDAQFGVRLSLENGIITDESLVAANVGTDVSIANIFYNIPARKKFLKTRETEWRHIVHLVHAYCLAYNSIHFELFSDDQQILNCPPAKDIHERVIQLWHYDIGSRMLQLCSTDKEKNIIISGTISDHQYSQYDRSNIYVFVNNRWVKNNHLIKAILKGYANSLQPGKFPAAVLSVSIAQAEIDVNVHPRKEEVKFLHPHTVENLIAAAVKKALEHNINSKLKRVPDLETKNINIQESVATRDFTPLWQTGPITSKIFIPKEQVEFDKIELPEQDITAIQDNPIHTGIGAYNPDQIQIQDQTQIFIDQDNLEQQPQESLHNLSLVEITGNAAEQAIIIGQFNKTYIVLEHTQGLMIIDQHAAHERILYEQFAKRFDEIATVKLLFPTIINLPAHDIMLLENHKELLIMHGIIVESFGQTQIIIRSTPVTMQHIDLHNLVKQFIALIYEHEHLDAQELKISLTSDIRSLMACKAAVKAGDILNHQQMRAIVDDLAKTDNNVTCPHGRPTSWILECSEIEKKFKRDYKSKQARQ